MPILIKKTLLVVLITPFSAIANEAAVEFQKAPDVMGFGNIVQIIAGLFVVLMMIMGAAWMMKRYGGLGGVSNADLKIVAGISVGQREKIVVVQAGDTQVLVGIAPGNIQTLHVLENNLSTGDNLKVKPSAAEGSNGFMNHLKQQVKKRAES
ncbi:hypothetical protein MNBD_GAMMA17-1529 [hydrothermal vent metagenome]|uniref:Flagellar protein n=1 Tax=hydrothermal vent metagenome TaxID=652676 RepID=A0A3B0Z614_9ZZZZ